DRNSGLKGLICIHNTTLGPALGGTRVWEYENEEDAVLDVLRLARGMTKKAACAGLNLGGGKAVIIGNSKQLRKDTVKREAFWRAFGRYVESLGGRYITAEDVGTTPEDMTLVRMETDHVLGLPTTSGDPSPFTAYGVFKGIKACLKESMGSSKLEGIRVAVSGVGHVGAVLCDLLYNEGAILTIADIDEEAVKEVAKKTNATVVDKDKIYDVDCDVFAPCALGAVINDNTIPRLKCKIIAGAANNMLEDSQKHGTKIHEMGLIYAPDYVINAGGLINVYQEKIGYSKEASMHAIDMIYDRVREIIVESKETNTPTYLVADRMAERRIEMMRNINSIHIAK
ncbi:MAG: Glu/Leu/Phe/Val dehydrogenase dimerization domain-containing protein, partial [Erysipelotrichaceae bacterium]